MLELKLVEEKTLNSVEENMFLHPIFCFIIIMSGFQSSAGPGML
jgi:hypothetical protein